MEWRRCAQAHLSAETASSQADPRVSGPDEQPRWPKRATSTSAQGQEAALRLTSFRGDSLGHGMRRAQRLTQRREFTAVYRRGRAYRSELLILRTLPSGQPVSRFGFTTRKALGKAVVRNRLKRRLREAVRSLPVAPGWDMVLNARSGAVGVDYHRLREAVADLMARAKVLEQSEEDSPR